jgi:hypothetical protein
MTGIFLFAVVERHSNVSREGRPQSNLLLGRPYERHGNDKMENGTNIFRNGDPSPCFALRNLPLPQGARERQNGKQL